MTRPDDRNEKAYERPVSGPARERGAATTEATLLRPAVGAVLVLASSVAFGITRDATHAFSGDSTNAKPDAAQLQQRLAELARYTGMGRPGGEQIAQAPWNNWQNFQNPWNKYGGQQPWNNWQNFQNWQNY